MSELEKLKSDLEKLYAAHAVTLDMNCENIALGIKSLCSVVEKEISKQNVQEDEWERATETLAVWFPFLQQESSEMKRLARYIQHLEAKVNDLEENLKYEAELKQLYRKALHKNRKYYCLKNDKGEVYKHLFNTVAIFATLEEAEFAAKHISDPGFEASVYTRNS